MPTTEAALDSGLDVLRHARSQRSIALAAEVEVLIAAVTWAEQHPPESIGLEATWKSGAGDTGLPLAGAGAPLVAEFCIAELALAIGCSTEAGRVLIAHGLELKYRLPRHVTFHHEQVNFDGTTHVEPELDLGDALDFEAAIIRGAQSLKTGGSEETLDVRRAQAVGEIARRQLALDLSSHLDEPTTGKVKPRQVVLYVHLSESALTGNTGRGLEIALLEQGRHVLTADQMRTWCANRDTQIVVEPVIDLAEHLMTESYQTPDRLEEQSQVRDGTCVFPWCARPARRTDCDQVVAYDRGGATCSCNIAPLCRRHHRLKTHTQWTYTVLELGSYLWTSPHGYQFLRDHEGTLDVSTDRRQRWTSRSDFPHLTCAPDPGPDPPDH